MFNKPTRGFTLLVSVTNETFQFPSPKQAASGHSFKSSEADNCLCGPEGPGRWGPCELCRDSTFNSFGEREETGTKRGGGDLRGGGDRRLPLQLSAFQKCSPLVNMDANMSNGLPL